MAVQQQNIRTKFEWLGLALPFLFFVVILFRVFVIQQFEGDVYREKSRQRTVKNDTIYANRGNVYATHGDLLATSMTKYEVRMDMVTVKPKVFEKYIGDLSDSLSVMFGKPSRYYASYLRKAKRNKNRYLLIARNLGYVDYSRLKTFPLLKLGPYKGGFIVEQKTVRAHPLKGVAQRTVGYADYRGNVGIEGAYIKHLKGEHGWRKKQKIAKGQWKPLSDANELEPKDGSDVVTTIDVNIQDIAHHALLGQMEKFEADHGCVVVMETETGEIKAIANLGKSSSGAYYEKRNYAIYEAHEPGSTFKVASLLVALEDKVIDTGEVIDTGRGLLKVYGRRVEDSHHGGYGEITVSEVIEKSSNVGVVKFVQKHYKDQPQKFVDGIKNLGLGKKIGLPIRGEGEPYIPDPSYVKKGDRKSWSGLSLPWMSWGYGVSITPLQMLTFYNAIANDGVMVKPRFIKELRNDGEVIESYEAEVLNPQIASEETILKLQDILGNVVKRGTAKNIYTPNFTMAGKTGTCQTEYWTGNTQYVSSFAGFFPVNNPKYSCIVVVHKPNKKKGYYGATVAAPVFKAIAQKIYTETIEEKEVSKDVELEALDANYDKFYSYSQKYKTIMPGVKGMPMMDAVALLENMGMQVEYNALYKVKSQSVMPGQKIKKGQTVFLN